MENKRKMGTWPMNSTASYYLDSIEERLPPDGQFVPSRENLYRALELTPLERIAVVIVGQDPYPNPEHATGLAFGVPEDTWPLPRTLRNIMQEAGVDELTANKGRFDVTLEDWARQGVLLLNASLTTEPGTSRAHAKMGWELFTESILNDVGYLRADRPLVVMLWGRHASSYDRFFDGMNHLVLKTSHPSPLSAHGGFLGCRHFELCNTFLLSCGRPSIDWKGDRYAEYDYD